MTIAAQFSKVLLKAGIKSGSLASTALFDAIDNDDAASIALILEKDPAAATRLFRTADDTFSRPLDRALQQRKDIAAQALVAAAPSILTQVDPSGANYLMRELDGGLSGSTLQFLVSLYPRNELGAPDADGNTWLHHIAQHPAGILGLEKALPLTPAEANAKNLKGETPLIVAAQGTDGWLLAAVLLNSGAQLNATDNHGRNATMHAIREHELKTATRLMERGGAVDFNDPAVDAQRHAAKAEGNTDFLKALEKRRKAQEQEQQEAQRAAEATAAVTAQKVAAQRTLDIAQAVRQGTTKPLVAKVARFTPPKGQA